MVRKVLTGAMIGLCGASACLAETPYEQAVLAELNAARADPATYANKLAIYRTYFRAKLVRLPGSKVDIQTEEGVDVVDETIAYLKAQTALATLAPADLLRSAAKDHVDEQARSGETGHDGEDGSEPADRVRRRGGGAYVAEVIAYGPVDPVDVVRQLIVDDGVADRGHRMVLFSPELRFAGVSCGTHPEYRTMCVIDMGMTPDATFPKSGAVTASTP
jgi:uncharacterized protein YkwD